LALRLSEGLGFTEVDQTLLVDSPNILNFEP